MTGARRPPSRPTALLAAAAVVLVVAAGCTGGATDEEADAAEAAPDSTVESGSVDDPNSAAGDPDDGNGAGLEQSAVATAVGQILDDTGEGLSGAELETHLARRFEAYWLAFDIARQSPSADPEGDYPELAALAAGELLELTFEQLEELFLAGHALRNPETAAVSGLDANSTHRIRVDRLEVGVAEIESCQVNDQVRVAVVDGEVLSDSVLTVLTRSTMARTDGSWKVIRSEATELVAGVAGCWLEDESAFPY